MVTVRKTAELFEALRAEKPQKIAKFLTFQ